MKTRPHVSNLGVVGLQVDGLRSVAGRSLYRTVLGAILAGGWDRRRMVEINSVAADELHVVDFQMVLTARRYSWRREARRSLTTLVDVIRVVTGASNDLNHVHLAVDPTALRVG